MKTLLFVIGIIPFILFAQDKDEILTQTVRGTVVDAVTNSTLIGAYVTIVNSNPLKGTTTDIDGNFTINNVSIGRIDLKISYIGYEDRYLNNIDVLSSKQLVLTIELEEKIYTTEEVTVTAESDKERPLNDLATVSARTFTVEETQRYAGSLGDPSRMAQNYAGVMSAGDSRNDIIIRGNSPVGLLWRMEGIDIPNPNHFAATGTTGGSVSILNNNLLTNSDFFTGAFPAEYGNAISGVFDLRMRNGNNQKHEFIGQIGFNGFELGAEGPFSKKSQASYLVNYRYSTLAVFDAIGLKNIVGSSVPQYQDLTFKVNLPTKNAGHFVLYGIGGTSFIQIWDSEKGDNESSYGLSGTDTDFGSDLGILGFYNVYYFNKNTRLKTNISVSGTRATTALDSLRKDNNTKYQFYRSNNSEVKYSISTHLTHKFSAKDMITTGIIADHYEISYEDSVYRTVSNSYFKTNDVDGGTNLFQAYSQWKHNFSSKLNFNIGLHYQIFSLNNTQSLEPRTGIEWDFLPTQTLSFSYGLLSQTQPKTFYFVETELSNGNSIKTNTNLGFTKSNQYVIAYNNYINNNLRIKVETYYQQLNNVPVSQSISDYSILNVGSDFNLDPKDSLVNEGTGENYGIEFTLERFFENNYYFLATTSLFRSKYKGYDTKEYSTAFDNKYIFNLLGGYEFIINSISKINVDIRGIYAGGKPYTPIDIQKSMQENKTVYEEGVAFTEKHKDYFRLDFKIGYKISIGHTDQEWSFEVQNITDYKNVFQQVWDPMNQKVKTDYQQGFFPMVMYRIHF